MDEPLQIIMEKLKPLGGVSIMTIGYLLQVPPGQQQNISANASKGTYDGFSSFSEFSWDV